MDKLQTFLDAINIKTINFSDFIFSLQFFAHSDQGLGCKELNKIKNNKDLSITCLTTP